MEIKHRKGDKNGYFYYEEEGKELALMAYVWAGTDKLIIDHTEVDDTLKGQGVGKQLLFRLVEFVREEKVKVIPLCPFANATLKKTIEWQDVVA
jgi:uncharacterized protein